MIYGRPKTGIEKRKKPKIFYSKFSVARKYLEVRLSKIDSYSVIHISTFNCTPAINFQVAEARETIAYSKVSLLSKINSYRVELIIAVVRAVGSIVVTGTQLVSSGKAVEDEMEEVTFRSKGFEI